MRNTILLTRTLSLAAILTISSFAEDTVPEGLLESDWSSIREAYEAGRHAVQHQEDGSHSARNPGQQWRTEFDGRGFLVHPKHGNWTWGMDLKTVDGQSISAPPKIGTDGNTLRYQWNERVEEWFINDQRGLEQGWTINAGIADDRAALTLTFKLRGALRPVISSDGTSVAFQDQDTTALTYGGLKAWDANDKPLAVRFAPGEDELSLAIHVNDTEATYPITIDPIAQQAYMKASNAGGDDNFGSSVAIFGDTVVVGAPHEDGDASSTAAASNDNASSAGAAYVFVRSGTGWSQQAYLKSSNAGSNDKFGFSVAVSGGTVVIGAIGEDGDASSTGGVPNNNAADAGAVYIFVRSGTNWSQQAYLKASNTGAYDLFGTSVAIDNDTVVVGSYRESGDASSTVTVPNDHASSAGAAYVFLRGGTNWSQQAYLKAANAEAFDSFGCSVAVSGETVVVGSYRESGDASSTIGAPNNDARSAGAAYIFVRSGTSWSQQTYLKASNSGAYDWFGDSVAIDGDTVVVGAPFENGDASSTGGVPNENATEAGAAYIFVRSGASWSQQAYLKAANAGASDSFGNSVAIDGETVVVGSWQEDGDASSTAAAPNDDAPYAGAAYVFGRAGASWSQRAYLKASNSEAFANFGRSVAIDGDTVVVGADAEAGDASSTAAAPNSNAYYAGATYVFNLDARPEIAVEEPAGTDLVDAGVPVDFGIGLVGSSSDAKVFTVHNIGDADLAGLSVSLSGAAAGDYSVDDSLLGTVITQGGSATFSVTFSPTMAGTRTALLQIASNDDDENPFEINLSGESLTPLALAQQAYLKADNAESNDYFGWSVAVSGDTVVVGAPFENGNSFDAGATYIFVRDGASWSQQAYLVAGNAGAEDNFGGSVAIDGDTVVIGAYFEDGDASSTVGLPNNNATNAGAAYVFVRSGTTWGQQAYLKASNAEVGAAFGQSVAVSGDTVVVGANDEDGIASSAGAAYIFVSSGSSWSQQAYLKASNAGLGDDFGWSVAIDGNTVVVGAFLERGNASSTATTPNDNASGAGAAYVFVRSGTSWEQQAYLKASNAEAGDWFGFSVAISGETVVVGARNEGGDASSTAAAPNNNASFAGAVYVFVRDGESWGQQAYLKASNIEGGDFFGWSVAIDGDTVVAGAHRESGDASSTVTAPNNDLTDAGAAYVFVRSGTSWGQQAYVKASNAGDFDYFGYSVTVSGGTVVAGAYREAGNASSTATNPNNSALSAGAAYVFSASSTAEASFATAATNAGLTGPDAEPLATPFNDVVPNLLKYAFNMNLGGSDNSGLEQDTGTSGQPTYELDDSGPATVVRLQYIRRIGSGLVYTPMKSVDLTNGSFEPMNGTESTVHLDTEFERVTVVVPCDPATEPNCFWQVWVTLP